MNILFIYSLQGIQSLYKPLKSQEQIQFGISYISSVLKKHGYCTKLAVLSRESGIKNNRKILDDCIRNFNPRLVCFTAVFSEYEFIASIARYLKTCYKNIYLLIGGAHVSLSPEGVLNDGFDALCIGEGEYPTLELANFLKMEKTPSGILNLWIEHGDRIEKNPPRPFLQDLDSLPHADREMWQRWLDERWDSQHAVLLGRGCPFECTYCCNHALKKISSGCYVRFRSPDNIIDELKKIIDRFPNHINIYLEVETIYANKKWAFELCAKLENLNSHLTKPLAFGVNLRITPQENYEALFYRMQKSNFRLVNIGLESGSERLRKTVLKRVYSNIDIINTVKTARKYNLKVLLFNMIGFPGETFKDFKETVKMNRRCLPDWIRTEIFFPYPGTELYSLCKAKGLLPRHIDTENERSKAVLDTPDFTKKQIQKAYEWFYYDVYKGHKPVDKTLAMVFTTKLRRWPILLNFYFALTRLRVYKQLRLLLRRN